MSYIPITGVSKYKHMMSSAHEINGRYNSDRLLNSKIGIGNSVYGNFFLVDGPSNRFLKSNIFKD